MRTFHRLALVALVGGCHLDRLVSDGGGRGVQPSANPPAALVFATKPAAPRAGRPISPAIRINVVDSAGHPVAGADTLTVSVALAANPGGATLDGSTSAHPSHGVVTFADLRLDKAATGYTLTATTAQLPAVTSDTFTVVPGAAATLRFTAQPRDAMQDSTITPPVQVSAFDSLGNAATTFDGSIQLTLRADGSVQRNATLGGRTLVAATGGVATFSDLHLDRLGTGYTLAAGFSGATPIVESGSFNIIPAAPPPPGGATHLVFTDGPATTQAGTAVPAVRVTAYDASGNEAPGFTGKVTLTLGANPANGTLTGTNLVYTVTATEAGIAEWLDLKINNAGNGYTLRATSPGLIAATSDPFDITAGPPPSPAGATGLAFTQAPSSARAGAAMSPTVRVSVLDDAGNVASGFTGAVWIVIAANPSGGTLSGTQRAVAVNGIATFPNLSIDKAGSGYRLRISAASLAGRPRGVTSDPFDITP